MEKQSNTNRNPADAVKGKLAQAGLLWINPAWLSLCCQTAKSLPTYWLVCPSSISITASPPLRVWSRGKEKGEPLSPPPSHPSTTPSIPPRALKDLASGQTQIAHIITAHCVCPAWNWGYVHACGGFMPPSSSKVSVNTGESRFPVAWLYGTARFLLVGVGRKEVCASLGHNLLGAVHRVWQVNSKTR